MSFKYINPGYGVLTGDSSVKTVENFTYNPTNGVSFQKLGNQTFNEIIISTPQAFTTDIYGKFNLYFDNTNDFSNFSIGGYPANIQSTWYGTSGIGVQSWYDLLYLYDTGKRRGAGTQIKKRSLNSIWFHLHKDEEQEITSGELIVNDTETNFISDLNYKSFSSEPFFYISFPSWTRYGQHIYLSEIIISDQYIFPKEKIIELPIISLETNMTAGASGIYLANADNQTLFQSVDVGSLIERDEPLSITGVSIIGNPAYKIGAGVANLTALSKAEGSIIKHSAITLSGESTAAIMDSWGLSSITIAELQNMQFGWRVGT